MNHSPRRRAVLFACGALLAGCAGAEPPAEPPSKPVAGQPSENVDPHATSGGMKSAIEAALADAEKQTGLGRAELEIQSAETVTWPDGSLGCPRPGALYTQALVPGYRIRIKAGARVLDYHASARGGRVLCPAGRAVNPIQRDAI